MLNRAEVVSLRIADGKVCGAEVLVDGEAVDVDARVTVNAAGPWVDVVRRLEDPHAGTSVRLSKGAHVLVPGGEGWTAALTVPQDDVRVTFAVPWYGLLLLGTTDTDVRGRPRRRRGRRVGRGADPRRGVDGTAVVAARPRRRARLVRRAAGAAARRGDDRERAAGDRLLDRPGRDAERRRRKADDVPEDRARRARAGPRPARPPAGRPATVSASGREGGRTPVPGRGRPRGRGPSPPSLRQPRRERRRARGGGSVAARAAPSRRAGHRRAGVVRGHRRMGHRPPTTCCAGGRRLRCAAWRGRRSSSASRARSRRRDRPDPSAAARDEPATASTASTIPW